MKSDIEEKPNYDSPKNEVVGGADNEKESLLSLKRHDDHNLELKSLLHFDSGNIEGSVDIFLFLPPNVQAKALS
ncbi:MAG: hypothetical protein KDD45_12985, partial [Bdellovibrionales bacterium]|nr:hypothetical protein [Bdellovibrionales bacterium]